MASKDPNAPRLQLYSTAKTILPPVHSFFMRHFVLGEAKPGMNMKGFDEFEKQVASKAGSSDKSNLVLAYSDQPAILPTRYSITKGDGLTRIRKHALEETSNFVIVRELLRNSESGINTNLLDEYVKTKQDEINALKIKELKTKAHKLFEEIKLDIKQNINNIYTVLISKKLIKVEDKLKYPITTMNMLIKKAIDPISWYHAPRVRISQVRILSPKCLLNLGEIVFLFAVDMCFKDIKDGKTDTITEEQINKKIDQQTNPKPIHVKIVDNYRDLNHKLINSTAKLLVKDIKRKDENTLHFTSIPWKKLFINNLGEDEVQHLAMFGTKVLSVGRQPHHSIYIGGDYCVEQWAHKINETDKLGINDISIRPVNDFLKSCRNLGQSAYIFPYENKPSNRYLRQRAMWALGTYPQYDVINENCESFVNWVFQNRGIGESALCGGITSVKHKSDYVSSRNIDEFWNTLLNKGIKEITQIRETGVEEQFFYFSAKNIANSQSRFKSFVATLGAAIAARSLLGHGGRRTRSNRNVNVRCNTRKHTR